MISKHLALKHGDSSIDGESRIPFSNALCRSRAIVESQVIFHQNDYVRSYAEEL